MSEHKIETLITSLCEDASAEKPLRHPLLRGLSWILFSALYLTALLLIVGMRHDLSEKIYDLRFLFEIGLMGFIGLSAAICSVYLCVPDMRGRNWMISLPFSGLALFTIWNIVHITSDDLVMPKLHMDHCMGEGAFMSVIPLAILFFLVRKGATTRPIMMAVMNIISVTSIAYIGLRFTCAMDTVGHATVSHILPYALVGVLLAAAARKLYKW